jgi:hypothetical protein
MRGAGAASSCARCACRAAALHVVARFHKIREARQRERRSGGALCAAQRVHCCAGGQRTGAAGCCAQNKPSAAASHVAPRLRYVLESSRHARRSGSALCAPQRTRWCAGVRRAGAAGSCARCACRVAVLHVVPRCHEVLDARWRS